MVIEKVKKTIIKYRMLNRGDTIAVGVSGGADSVALLHILLDLQEEWNIYLIISHLDHSFRGEESRKEAEFVKKLASRLNLPFEFKTIDVPSLKKRLGKSGQEVAREVRYRFFEEVSQKYRANRIALGHNSDDQAESVLIRLIQGTGPRGLRGIPPVRENLYIRPLIELTRYEIEGYLNKKGIAFVNDSSNKKDIYLRNKIRLRLLPIILNDYNPRFQKNLIKLSSIIRQEDEYLDGIVKEIFPQIILRRGDDFLSLDIARILTLHRALLPRILRKSFETLTGNLRGINYRHLRAIMDMLDRNAPNRSIDLPRGIRAVREYNELSLRTRESKIIPPFLYTIKEPGTINLKEISLTMKFTILKSCPEAGWNHFHKNVAHFALNKIDFPLSIRNFRKGDRFQPLGMNGSKKVKDCFIAQKIPLKQRSHVPILLSGERIIWLVGVRIDNRVKVTETTGDILKVESLPVDA